MRVACALALLLCLAPPAAAAGVVAVAAGDHHTVAVTRDGGAWAWGRNDRGQLGDGTREDRFAPVRVRGVRDFRRIAAGGSFTLALQHGTVWAWGANEHGQLGDGSTADRSKPVPVRGLREVEAIAAGEAHGVALLRDGTVRAWGWNHRGQLGDGSDDDHSAPVAVRDLTEVVAVAAGAWHTLALKKDGTVQAWGANNDGRLGDGTTEHRPAPVRVKSLTDAVAIAAGRYHSAALRRDGTVVAWGCNWSTTWQLADATTMDSRTPVAVIGLTNMPALGKPVIPTAEPFRPLSNVTAIVAGAYHTLALKKDGTVWGWGNNYYWGELGDGKAGWRTNPVQARLAAEAAAVAAGKYHSAVLTKNGDVRVFGCNLYGQLAIGRADNRPHAMPLEVTFP